MHDLVVNSQLAITIGNDQDADATSALGEDVVQLRPQASLVDDGEVLLDVSSLGHCNDAAIVTNVKDTILLVDRSEHVLHHDRRRWVRDKARLFVELLGEEIDSEIAVLTRLSRDGDANDLAGTPLKDQQITEPNVMTRDGDGIRGSTAFHDANVLPNGTGRARAIIGFVDVDLLTHGRVMVMRMKETMRGLLDAVAERVVVTVFVVVAHLRGFLLTRLYGGVPVDLDVCRSLSWRRVFRREFSYDGSMDALAIGTLGHVDIRLGPMSCWAAIDFDVSLSVVMRPGSVVMMTETTRKIQQARIEWS